jgi:mono/diheme cytochrome c family protein
MVVPLKGERMLAAVFVLALAADAAASVEKGAALYTEKKCQMCHSVAGKGNAKGSLDGVGDKLSAADIRKWLTEPAEMTKKANATRKPAMPSFAKLPAADLDALTAYLSSLKKK